MLPPQPTEEHQEQLQQAIFALPGPEHWSCSGKLEIAGTEITVIEKPGQGQKGTGWAVWDASVVLARYLDLAAQQMRVELQVAAAATGQQEPTVVELGSGTGVAGLSAALALRLPTLLTDLPEVLPSLEQGVAANAGWGAHQLVSLAACDWSDPPRDAGALGLPGPPALVLAADCVWLEPLVSPFVSTLARLAGPHTRVLLAHQSRSARVDEALQLLLAAAGFVSEPVLLLPGEPPRGKIELRWLRRLEGGVGA